MDEYRNPIHAAEPFEASQGKEDVSQASPDVLAAFYKDMERKEIVERKLSKKMNGVTSIWSRKSVKRSATAQPAASPAQVSHQTNQARRVEEESVAISHNDSDRPDWVRSMNCPRSIIPDSKDLPVSHNKDVWNSIPHPSHRVRYSIHNPIGPRWYKNHHLIPPSETTPAARPPSFFSTSFPPIAASGSQDRLDDPTRVAGPSRTPSNSPLPTPNSSQTRVEDRARTRKLSETAHDVVDLLDVTDPWGTSWHHHSPYDIGLVNGAISVDAQDTRSRPSSMDQSRGRAIAPSPLSQSMSAINLHVKPIIQIPRKLSKRRTAPAGSQDTERHATSLPATPLGTRPSTSNLPKRMSVAAPLIGSSLYAQKKDDKGGVISRLVKKLSILGKPLSNPNKRIGQESNRQQVTAFRNSFAPSRKTSSEKPVSESGKRVPPPSVENPAKVDDTTKDIDASSVASFEAPYSIGRLTIANPDSPGSADASPAQGVVPLPPNKESLETASRNELTSYPDFSPIPQLDLNLPGLPEKILSPPTPPTKLSHELVSEKRPGSPIILRQPSPERSDLSSQRPKSTEHPPSTVNETSSPMQGSEVPGLVDEQSMSRPIVPSPQNSPRANDQPPSQSSQILPPAFSTATHVPVTSSTVPFPTENTREGLQLFYEYDYSPLSVSSILANPPTPQTSADKAILSLTDQPLPPLPSKISIDVPARQTETFRLVQSPSGNACSNEKIVAGGKHWEVVGAEKKAKGSLSPKEPTPKEPEPRSHERHHRDRDSKDRRDKEHESRDRDHRRGTKARDSRDGDHTRDSKDRHHHRDSKDREHGRDLDRDNVRKSKDRDYVRDGRDKDHRESRYRDHHDSDYHRKSRDRDYVRDTRHHGHDPRDRDYARDSKDKDRVRHSRDRDHARELREHGKDYNHDHHKTRDSRDRSHRDRESTSHSEKKRDSKARSQPATEADSRHRHRSQKGPDSGEGERSTTVPKAPVLRSNSRHHEQHDSKRGERSREDREPEPTRKRPEPCATTVNMSTTQTLPLLPTQDIPISRPLGRYPSLSGRPSSQLPLADEINALRAKEAWDMERLWKARSMQGEELNGYTIPSNHNTPVITHTGPSAATNPHGSSHTSFVQQKPHHSIYHSMPAAPPPIIYSPLSIPTVAHHNPPTSHRQSRTRIYAESVTSDRKSYTTAHTSNPLPEIPRESAYEIPADARNSEYWTKYAGLTTTA